ncbi:hypothetical protein EDB84DRAFT_1280923 [Lactarius hengduanensis]|nr:hypothetical protein EDB84DRAFT_1280923 [Lactarius hengduanensis]
MFPSFKSEGKFLFFFRLSLQAHPILGSQIVQLSFITAYREGLSGAQAAWANKKYHGHRTLPPQCILEARNAMDCVDSFSQLFRRLRPANSARSRDPKPRVGA